ncbi:MAG: TonB C-terminal domain-containing protein, partial [Elusimicrobia bacterium]|nr:TonB C-terminal domain-containing protein [Elusimicrobiota bacterium]
AAAFLLVKPQLSELKTSYSVDFIAATQSSVTEAPAAPAQTPEPAPAQPPAAKAETPKAEPSIAPVKAKPSRKTVKENDFALPAPSVLQKQSLASLPSLAAPEENAKPAAQAQPQRAASDTGGTAITAEFPNFPYPWYITQVRAALWNEWSTRMPSAGAISTVVGFRIQRNGKIEGVKVDKSSGNKLFDFAALSSAEQAAPFPPLPSDYKDSALDVHVEFKVGQ